MADSGLHNLTVPSDPAMLNGAGQTQLRQLLYGDTNPWCGSNRPNRVITATMAEVDRPSPRPVRTGSRRSIRDIQTASSIRRELGELCVQGFPKRGIRSYG